MLILLTLMDKSNILFVLLAKIVFVCYNKVIMKYFCINLDKTPDYNYSGISLNPNGMQHIERLLNDYELFLVTDGVLNLSHPDNFTVNKGEVLLSPAGVVQKGTAFTQNSFYWFHFNAEVKIFNDIDLAKSFCAENSKWIFFAEHFSLIDMDKVVVMLTELNHFRFELDASHVKNFLAGAVLSEVARQYKNASLKIPDKRFYEILGYINLHLTEDILVKDLAERFSYNVKYLTKLFKKFTGSGVIDYINGKRIEMAKGMLVSTNYSVKHVAKEIGFLDEYYFMRVFKKYTGMTPSSYRNVFLATIYS
jgi:AraC-like DNA-binding protein